MKIVSFCTIGTLMAAPASRKVTVMVYDPTLPYVVGSTGLFGSVLSGCSSTVGASQNVYVPADEQQYMHKHDAA
jgi:hypothetical protein